MFNSYCCLYHGQSGSFDPILETRNEGESYALEFNPNSSTTNETLKLKIYGATIRNDMKNQFENNATLEKLENPVLEALDELVGADEDMLHFFEQETATEIERFFGTLNANEITAMELYPFAWTVSLSVMLLLLSLGNILILTAPLVCKEIRNSRATILVTILAVADLLSCLSAAAENMYHAIEPHLDPVDQVHCFLYLLPWHLSSIWGNLLVLAMGLERIILVLKPLYYRFNVTRWKLLTLGFICLLIAFTFCLYIYLVLRDTGRLHSTCMWRTSLEDVRSGWPLGSKFLIAVSTAGLLVYLVFGVLMLRRYKTLDDMRLQRIALQTPAAMRKSPPTSDDRRMTIGGGACAERRFSCGSANIQLGQAGHLMLSLCLVISVNILSWVLILVVILLTIGQTTENVRELRYLVFMSPLLYLNSVCNCFIYAATSKVYQRAFRRVILLIFARRSFSESPSRGMSSGVQNSLNNAHQC